MKDNLDDIVGLSKYCSYLLRHHPEDLGLKMDESGWVSVEELVRKLNNNRKNKIDIDIIKEIVETDKKQRYAIEERKVGLFIRANQGHSIKTLNMGYIPTVPPDVLYHGTGKKYVKSIFEKGILHKSRQYVHLSSTIEMAKLVGQRHGEVRVFRIDSKRMYEDGIIFYCSENGVWLTDFVDKRYIQLI